MLTLRIEPIEYFDESTEKFVKLGFEKPVDLTLEHSLVSLAKWEAKWKTPFLVKDLSKHPKESILDYIRCMTIGKVPEDVYNCITEKQFVEIFEYIGDPMTATTFHDHSPKSAVKKNEVITAEIIYYWMISFGIQKDYEKWHLNRLIALINVCSIKNSPPRKMSRNEALAMQAKLNRERRAKYHTKG